MIFGRADSSLKVLVLTVSTQVAQCSSIARRCVAFFGVSASFDIWHAQLGHASSPVVSRVLRSHHLPISSSASPTAVCEFCQYDKANQLPFSASARVSSSPLELVHSDV
jgi:hypothetical protein